MLRSLHRATIRNWFGLLSCTSTLLSDIRYPEGLQCALLYVDRLSIEAFVSLRWQLSR